MTNPKRVAFPEFHLMGPSCLDPACSGVLVNHINTVTKEFYRECSSCGAESDRRPGAEVLNEAADALERALNSKPAGDPIG